MSSPIHYTDGLDAALRYAPPWARDRARPAPMPRAAQLVMSSQHGRGIGQANRRFSGDRAMSELQRQLALNPVVVPEPPAVRSGAFWPIARRLAAVIGLAALVAWGIVALPGTRPAGQETGHADIPPPVPVNRVKLLEVRSASAVPALVPDRLSKESQPPVPAEALSGPAPPAVASQAAGTALALDDDEIATLLKRGEDSLTNGDLASARLLLRRAVQAGSAEAALALGASYDPGVIARLGAVGAEPDIARARKWYQKAVALGSQVASQQLAKLVAAPQ